MKNYIISFLPKGRIYQNRRVTGYIMTPKLFLLWVYLSDLLIILTASQPLEIPTKKTAKPIYFALDNGPNNLTIGCFLGILICVVHGLYKRTLKGSSLSQKYNRGNIC